MTITQIMLWLLLFLNFVDCALAIVIAVQRRSQEKRIDELEENFNHMALIFDQLLNLLINRAKEEKRTPTLSDTIAQLLQEAIKQKKEEEVEVHIVD